MKTRAMKLLCTGRGEYAEGQRLSERYALPYYCDLSSLYDEWYDSGEHFALDVKPVKLDGSQINNLSSEKAGSEQAAVIDDMIWAGAHTEPQKPRMKSKLKKMFRSKHSLKK